MKYLTLDDTSPRSKTLVYSGLVLDKKTREWVRVENKEVPSGAFIRAGSTIEKTEAQARKMLSMNIYAPADTNLHFNLEQVFGEELVDFGVATNDGKEFGTNIESIANILRSHGIHTVEQVAQNAMGSIPFTNPTQCIAVQDILSGYGDAGQIEAWVALAKELLA